ncbi:MAG: hypothetical protein E7655_00840 [Ruminococcaceae bacterium]|nr:hypothetical protein [Oscillospiraceae bacterium]
MSKRIVSVAKGVVSGLIVGTAVGLISDHMRKPKSKFRKSACKTFESLSCMMHNIAEMTK